MTNAYVVFEIQPEWVLETEALGSKAKFWYRRKQEESPWLFKFPQPNTGQHWAEKIAAEIAELLDIEHARVELAVFEGTKGSASESFAPRGIDLYHGNQILAGKVLDYDPSRKFLQSDHTLANIFLALARTFITVGGLRESQESFAGYLVLDALIGNTDRHQENWGILVEETGNKSLGSLAPTFDHASSMGRELLDQGPGKTRQRLLEKDGIRNYAEKARGAIYWHASDAHGPSPLELVRRATNQHRQPFAPALAKLDRLERTTIETIVNRVPEDWMTPHARKFAVELMCYNLQELRSIAP